MKKPPTKKEKPLLAAPLAYGRLRRPPLSLLFSLPSAAAPPPFLALSALLSPLVGGCAAPPLCFSSRASYGRLRRPLAILSYTMKSRLSETHMGIGIPLSPDCENQRFSCQGLLRLSLSEACFVTVTCHELICSPLDFASARHPKGPLSKATGFLHILP